MNQKKTLPARPTGEERPVSRRSKGMTNEGLQRRGDALGPLGPWKRGPPCKLLSCPGASLLPVVWESHGNHTSLKGTWNREQPGVACAWGQSWTRTQELALH